MFGVNFYQYHKGDIHVHKTLCKEFHEYFMRYDLENNHKFGRVAELRKTFSLDIITITTIPKAFDLVIGNKFLE